MNEVTNASHAKEQKTISTSELTEEDVEKLPDKEFLKIIVKLLRNEKHTQDITEFKEYVT